MTIVDATSVSQYGTAPAGLLASVHPGMAVLRRAIRANAVSFPSHVPILLKQPSAEMQWRSVLLYFVCGWTSTAIAARFNVPVHRVCHLLNQWAVRAAALGYIQVIDSEAFATCCHVRVDHASSISGLPASHSGFADGIPSIVAAKRLLGTEWRSRASSDLPSRDREVAGSPATFSGSC